MMHRSIVLSLVLGFSLNVASQAAKPSKTPKVTPAAPVAAPVAAPADSAAPQPAPAVEPVAPPAPPPAAKPASRPAPSGPSFTDSRDGKAYGIATIGDRVWMAENLDFKTDPSQCYENVAKNCETYGRLYTWKTAQSVCPDGWHLPSDEEWAGLERSVGDSAGHRLKSTQGWVEGPGSDALKFAGLPAGNHDKSGYFRDLGYAGGFWTSSDKLVAGGVYRQLDSRNARFPSATASKQNGFSVRCVRN